MHAGYEKVKGQSNAISLERSERGRDITAGYPEPGDLEARKACERDFRLFCEWYFPAAFPLAWSEDHLRVIARMQDVILGGGLFALAMPRGSGKTTLAVRAALWALCYGHRRFVSLVAATEDHAKGLLRHFKAELSYNEALGRDHRQVCYPIRRLENNGRKAIGQLFDGQQTSITWGDDRLTLPIMPEWACDGANVAGSTITVSGLTGSLRGQSATLPTGEILRPELVLLDDPQTRESAMSPSQSASREAIIKGDVLGMAGPDRRIAALMACTVIRKGDMADLMLERDRNPAWSGQKAKMVYSFPTAGKLWDDYHRLWAEEQKAGKGTAAATELYRQHRAEMDEGAVVAWPQRHYPDELSAVQHAMNLRFLDEAAFFAEYQNEPMEAQDASADDLTPDQVSGKLNRLARGEVPVAVQRLTAFIDVHSDVHYYVVCGWEEDFTGYVIQYGTFPEQGRQYFAKREAAETLERILPDAGTEAQVYAGLEGAAAAVLGREWTRDDGAAMRIDRCLIDSNWGPQTETVLRFARHSAHPGIILPSKGKYYGAASRPMNEWARKPGDRKGSNWYIPAASRREVRSVVFDTNFWKSFVLARFLTPMGGKGCLSLFGSKPGDHRLFADHLTAEFHVATSGQGRRLDEWKKKPGDQDNHWWDCLVGCAVAASIEGVTLDAGGGPVKVEKPAQVSFADLYRNRKRRA